MDFSNDAYEVACFQGTLWSVVCGLVVETSMLVLIALLAPAAAVGMVAPIAAGGAALVLRWSLTKMTHQGRARWLFGGGRAIALALTTAVLVHAQHQYHVFTGLPLPILALSWALLGCTGFLQHAVAVFRWTAWAKPLRRVVEVRSTSCGQTISDTQNQNQTLTSFCSAHWKMQFC